MRICYDARLVLNWQTGLSRYSYRLIEFLLRVDDKNEYVVLANARLRPDHPLRHLDQDNAVVEFVNVPGFGIQHQLLFPLVEWNIECDVYHYPHFDFPILSSLPGSVRSSMDMKYLRHPRFLSKWHRLKSLYARYVVSIGLKKVKRVIAISESTKRDIVDIFGCSPNQIEAIHLGCDTGFSSAHDENEARKVLARYGILGEYFLFAGANRPHKNLVRLVRAFSRIADDLPDHVLVIIGSRYSGYTEPQETVTKVGLQDRVRFLGHIPDEELVHFYVSAVSFVFPSLYEGFGLPILEAMACGTPVISSNVTSMPEIAGDAAILVDPMDVADLAEAMRTVALDSKLRQTLIEKGMRRAKDFSWERTARRVLAVYEAASSA